MKEFQEYFEAARQLSPQVQYYSHNMYTYCAMHVLVIDFYLQIQISGRAYHMESYRNREGKLRTKEVDTFHARWQWCCW